MVTTEEIFKLSLEDFCQILAAIPVDLTHKAVILLWHHDLGEPNREMTAGQLASVMSRHGVGSTNPTYLAKSLRRTGMVLKGATGFHLKASAKTRVLSMLKSIISAPAAVSAPIDSHFFPKEIWNGTRGYIEKVCIQINGCYRSEYFDAASVMVRRLIETLIIECYEHLKQEIDIRDGNGDYFSLSKLITAALSPEGLSLGRDTKTILKEIKRAGDLSAHNRRYNAVKPDLDKFQSDLRIAAQELIHIAALK
jgi:hypothetical protein